MVLFLCNNANIHLLVVLSLSSCLRTCGGILEEGGVILTSQSATRPEVRTPHGKVRGINMVTHHGRNILGFKGIPFAQPPLGSLSKVNQSWLITDPKPESAVTFLKRTLDASNDPEPCPQPNGKVVIGKEDCLYLNVYTPRLPASKNSTLLPVMFYVFGGGFKKGSATSADWSPYFILDKDVVLVVPNYRLGLLGFLSTGDEVAPGNYGLKDLVQALKWNRENVEYFGGDPNQVTLAGGSSGTMSVKLLTLFNSTNGLFHRYITQSGTALSPDAYRPRRAYGNPEIQLGKFFGCSTNTSKLLIQCLRTIDTSQLVNSDRAFYVWKTLPMNTWGPSIEPDVEGALLTNSPANLFAAGKIRDLPWLTSLVQNEGLVYRTQDWGAVHGYEILYLLQPPSTLYGPPEYKMNENDCKMVDTMVQFWTSFVINGMPTTANSNNSIIWKPYSSRKDYLRIGSNSDISLELKYDFFENRLQFWKELAANNSRN